ncbi:MAG: hypothetical protein Q8R79_02255 [Legionellaceae bacterium]|nr:hypothetical protein [Legionellaceae bacterium]
MFVAVSAVLPLMAWCSVATVALLTLRNGSLAGGRALLVGMLAYALAAMWTIPAIAAFCMAFMSFIPCYIAAYILRATASWSVSAVAMVFFACIGVILVLCFFPDFMVLQYQSLLFFLKNSAGSEQILPIWLQNPELMAHLLLGLEAVSFLLSTMSSLYLARLVQSKLYYPEGLYKDFFYFRGSYGMLALLLCASAAAYTGYMWAWSLLPVVVLFFLAVGFVVALYVLTKKSMMLTSMLLLLALMLVPFLMLPVFMLLACVDVFFDFKTRWARA